MIRCLVVLATLAASLIPAASLARKAGDVTELRAAPAALNPTKAYILFRSSRAKTGMQSIDHVFLRIPTAAENDAWRAARQIAYDAALPKLRQKVKDGAVPLIEDFAFDYDGPQNTFSVDTSHFLVDGPNFRTYLVEVPRGEYVVYGAFTGQALITCNCLGSVAFQARPGVITDIGTLYVDKVHKASPLAPLESNVGPSMFRYGLIFGQAVVPPPPDQPPPAILATLAVQPAKFRAVGPYRDHLAVSINRLAPIPGILVYDRGKVIDVQSGTVAGR